MAGTGKYAQIAQNSQMRSIISPLGTMLALPDPDGNLHKELSEARTYVLNYNGKITIWEEIVAVEFYREFWRIIIRHKFLEVREEVAPLDKSWMQLPLPLRNQMSRCYWRERGSITSYFLSIFCWASGRKLTRRHISTKNNQRP